MKLYIWEGDGISGSYHDDGTLVVLAESPGDARAVVRKALADHEAEITEWDRRLENLAERLGYRNPDGTVRYGFWGLDEVKALGRDPEDIRFWDGDDSALDREPDRVVDVTTPCIVAFNGGGYD